MKKVRVVSADSGKSCTLLFYFIHIFFTFFSESCFRLPKPEFIHSSFNILAGLHPAKGAGVKLSPGLLFFGTQVATFMTRSLKVGPLLKFVRGLTEGFFWFCRF